MTNRLVSVDSTTNLFPAAVMAAAGDVFKLGRAVSVNPSMTQTAIQTILNGVTAGTRVAFAPGTYTLAGPLIVAVDSTHIDALKATFIQTTWGQPGFDAIGRNGCVYDIGMVQWSGTRGGIGSLYRGSPAYDSTAGVWINGDYNWVRKLKTSGMPVGVFLSSWAGSTAIDHVGVGNRLGIIEVDNYNFGVLYVGQQDLVIDDLYGHDDLDDSGGTNPTHVLYCSAATSFHATSGYFKSLRAKNNLTGQPFQLKYHDSLHIGSMTATNCAGLLNVIDSNDLTVDSYSTLGTLANGGQGSISFQVVVTNSQRPKFGPGYIQQAANVDERAFNVLSDKGDFDRIVIDTTHSGSINPAANGEILVRGTGNRIRRPTIRATGTVPIPGIWVGYAGAANGTVVEGASVFGTLNVGKVDSSSTGVVFNYDAALQSFSGSTAIDLTGGNVVSTTTAAPVTLSTFGEHAALALLANASITVGAANTALQTRVTTRRNIAVSSLSWWSATASGNYDIGIVDDATNVVLWSRGSTAWPAAGKITETVTGVSMIAGRTYRLVFSSDNVTGTLRGNQATVVGLDQRLDGSTIASASSTSFPIPTPSLSAGGAGSTTRTPLIVVGGV